MLKIICRLFLGFIVCAGSACVTPTHASSASPILLTVVQAFGAGGAKDELVSFYNNSTTEQDVTGWCLQNKATISFACLGDTTSNIRYILPAFSSAVFASAEHLTASGAAPEQFTKLYSVTNQSSGSLVGSSDTVALLSSTGVVVDSYSWSTSHVSGKAWVRSKIGTGQGGYVSTGLPSDWQASMPAPGLVSGVFERDVTLPGDPESENPVNETDPGDENDDSDDTDDVEGGEDIMYHPYITEALPNPSGSDAGQEFIELYNPNESTQVLLDGYVLRVGPMLEKSYTLPASYMIPPLSYAIFTSEDIAFTLVNSTSSVQLEYMGVSVGDAITYNAPADGKSWALVGESWQYVSPPSPGEENNLPETEVPGSDESGDDQDDGLSAIAAAVTAALKPCAANQYRSPETNRCRLIQTASASTPAPCKQGQMRNAETNRCRNIASETNEAAACKAGQERNPDTNRCRNIVKMTDASHGVKGAAVQSANTGVSLYAWLAIAGIVLLVVGYAVWEWRHEIVSALKRLRQKFLRRST